MNKKISTRLLAAFLLLALLACTLSSCASLGEPMMELDGEEMTVNTFMLLLSRMKGKLASGYYYGEKALRDSFYDTIMSEGGKTYGQYFKEEALNEAKQNLAALYLFREYGLELPASYTDEVESGMEELVNGDGDGSETTLNAKLKSFGANYDILKNAYLMEAKIAYLNDYLFGADGSKIAANLVEDYYQKNYVRFRHVFLYSYDLEYELDENGDVIYYSVSDPQKISYDTSAHVKKDSDGVIVRDKNGDAVYVDDDGRIAYNRKNGKRSPVLDENGKQKTRQYTTEELIALSEKAQMIYDACEEGNYTLFDSFVDKYGEDVGMDEFSNGYFVTRRSDYEEKVLDALFEMKDGEVRRIDVKDTGIYIVMRYELEKGGYSKKANEEFFVDKTDGSLVFLPELKSALLSSYLTPYVSRIKIDEELLSTVDLKSVGANFYY